MPMLLRTAFCALLCLPQALHAQDKPSVAVLLLEPKNGVTRDVAELLTENLIEELRASGQLKRVVSSKEVETLLSLEQQRQMVNCNDDSCVAEIAGALGVEWVLAGTIGKLGGAALINLKLLESRSGRTVSSLSLKVCADNDEKLLNAVRPATMRLLRGAGFSVAELPIPDASDCRVTTSSVVPAAVPAATPATPPETGGNRFRIAGGVLAGAAAVGLVVGVVVLGAAIAGVAALQIPTVLRNINTFSLTHESRIIALYSVPAATGVLALLVGLLAVGSGVAALAFLGLGFRG